MRRLSKGRFPRSCCLNAAALIFGCGQFVSVCTDALSAELQPAALYAQIRSRVSSTDPAFTAVLPRAVPIDLIAALGSSADQFRTAFGDLLNSAISPDWIAAAESGGVGQRYKQLIEHAEWGRQPFLQPEADEYQELVNSLYIQEAGRYSPRDPVKRLLALQRAVNDAQRELNSTPPAQQTPELKARLVAARSALANDAVARSQIPKVARLRTLVNYDYSRRVPQLTVRFAANAEGEKPRTQTSPTASAFSPPAAAWSSVEFNLSPDDAIALPSFPVPPIWCCDLPTEITSSTVSGSIKVSFDFAKLQLRQPWLDNQILSGAANNIWRLPDGFLPLSRGPAALDQSSQVIDLTVLPNEIILIRNLRLTALFGDKLLSQIADASSTNKQYYFGPFAVAGMFKFGSIPVSVRPFGNDVQTLLVPDVQVLGFTASILQPLPSPKASLLWGQSLPNLSELDP